MGGAGTLSVWGLLGDFSLTSGQEGRFCPHLTCILRLTLSADTRLREKSSSDRSSKCCWGFILSGKKKKVS